MVVILLMACSEADRTTVNINAQFQPMLDSFLVEASRRGVNVSADVQDVLIRFGRMEGRIGGSCKPNGYPKLITIDSVKWKYIDSHEKEALLFHELAHCALMRPHKNGSFQFGECTSLLREHVSTCHLNWSNERWREYYLDELFKPAKTTQPYWYSSVPAFHYLKDPSSRERFRLNGSKFRYFDSTYIEGFSDWVICFSAKRSEKSFHVIGVRVNQIVLETSFVASDPKSDETAYLSRLIIINESPRRILFEVNAPREWGLSLQKYGHAIYIFFGPVLRYVLPIDPADLKIGAYSSLPEDHYDIDFYRM